MSEAKTRAESVSRDQVLNAVVNAKGTKTPTELAAELNMKPNTFVQAVQKLRTVLRDAGRSVDVLKMKREPKTGNLAGLLTAFDNLTAESENSNNAGE